MSVNSMNPYSVFPPEFLAGLTDDQIKMLARARANNKFQNDGAVRATKTFSDALPFLDSAVRGATTKGTVGKKTVAAGGNLKDWGGFLLILHGFNKVLNKVFSKSETLQNIQENHPVSTQLVSGIVGAGVATAGWHYACKGIDKIWKRLRLTDLESLKAKMVDKIDKSGAGQAVQNRVVTPIQNFFVKRPTAAKYTNIAAKTALPVLCLAAIGTYLYKIGAAHKQKKEDIKMLQAARDQAINDYYAG